MRRSLARFSEPESSVHTRSLAGFITTTSGFRFSVHTARLRRERALRRGKLRQAGGECKGCAGLQEIASVEMHSYPPRCINFVVVSLNTVARSRALTASMLASLAGSTLGDCTLAVE